MNEDRVLIVGVGNQDRGDDAIGLAVAERLVDDGSVMLSSGDPAKLIAAWEKRRWVIVVDAVSTGQPAGTVTVAELLDAPIPSGVAHSSHALGPLEAVQIGAALGMLPERITLVGIEADAFVLSKGLSESVEAAVDPATQVVRSLIAEAARAGPPPH